MEAAPNEIIAAIAVIHRDGKILLARRLGAIGFGLWALIGGKLDAGESLRQGLIREVAEEIGVPIKHAEIFREDIHRDPLVPNRFRVFTFFVEISGEPVILEPNKHSDMAWFSPDELPQDLFETAPGQFNEIRQLLPPK